MLYGAPRVPYVAYSKFDVSTAVCGLLASRLSAWLRVARGLIVPGYERHPLASPTASVKACCARKPRVGPPSEFVMVVQDHTIVTKMLLCVVVLIAPSSVSTEKVAGRFC